jgi:ribosomal protein S18 acetylase RimI-like enzyme
MAEPRIRRAGSGDWSLIWPVWHEIIAAGDTYAYDPDTSFDQGKRMWFGPLPEETWVAASDEDDMLGTYHFGPNHSGPGAHIANASYMVAPAARGRGVGRAMVEHSLQRAAELGYLGLQFNAVAATNRPAIKLYEELGFGTVGVIPRGFRHPSAGLVDLLIMYREVTPIR